MSSKKSVVGAMLLFSALAATAVQARSDVQWSVAIGTPVAVPVYVHPYPVHARPVPVLVQQPVGYGGRYYQPAGYGDRDGDGIRNRYDRVFNPHWDRDGDGIPNRHDRVFNPHWDRDGDGVPNRYDRHDNRYRDIGVHDRDRDGIPNWQDRHDGRRDHRGSR